MAAEALDFASSALVVAHPDDEVLWFSSIAGRVAKLIVVYEDCADLPALGAARRAASGGYPLGTARFLRHAEPCSLDWVNWKAPLPSPFGMVLDVPGAEAAAERYRSAYEGLRQALAPLLADSTQVFTHNAWGEYGHPDHVQVSRVIQDLEPELGYRTLCSSYVAPRSMRFASEFLPDLRQELTLATDRALAERVKALYTSHGCWTWYADYVPPATEAFLVRGSVPSSEAELLTLHCLTTT